MKADVVIVGSTSPKLPFRSAFVESVAKVRLYFKYARLLNKKN